MLFTDIEGSTRLLKQLGDCYGELLSEHRRLLPEAFAGHGGRTGEPSVGSASSASESNGATATWPTCIKQGLLL